jgi:hypothetical protein
VYKTAGMDDLGLRNQGFPHLAHDLVVAAVAVVPCDLGRGPYSNAAEDQSKQLLWPLSA